MTKIGRPNKLIAVDFDHTLVDNLKIQEGQRFPPLFEGAKEAIQTLKASGHKILIHSCNRKGWIEEALKYHEVPYDYIWDGQGKPNCDLFIDDCGLRFEGNWPETTLKAMEYLK